MAKFEVEPRKVKLKDKLADRANEERGDLKEGIFELIGGTAATISEGLNARNNRQQPQFRRGRQVSGLRNRIQ